MNTEAIGSVVAESIHVGLIPKSHRAERPGQAPVAAPQKEPIRLTQIVAMVLELSRTPAIVSGTQIQLYTLDACIPLGREYSLLAKLDRLLGRVLLNAQRGGRVSGAVEIRDDRDEVHVLYPKPRNEAKAATSEIDWIDEFWSWRLDDTEDCH